jgi:elongation factor G
VTGTGNLAGSMMVVSGVAPLSELDGYASRLKAITQGQGSFAMELARYEAVPPPVQQQLAADYKGRRKVEEED